MISIVKLFEQFQTVPELLRWAKKEGLFPKQTVKKPELKDGEYAVPYKVKEKKLNIKTGRQKKLPSMKFHITKVKPEDRTLKNIPKYADGRPKVKIKDWLELKKSPKLYDKLNDYSWGWSPNGKCYGWSHRAIHGFKVGDKIKKDSVGNNSSKEWVIKNDKQAEEMAKKFAQDVS